MVSQFVVVPVSLMVGTMITIGITVLTSKSNECPVGPFPPICAEAGYKLENNAYCYKTILNEKFYSVNVTDCRNDGNSCHLVTIETESENTFLKTFVKPFAAANCTGFYTSGFRAKGATKEFDWWEYSSGNYKPFAVKHWAGTAGPTTEPPADPANNFYLALKSSEGSWDAVGETAATKYCAICECDD